MSPSTKAFKAATPRQLARTQARPGIGEKLLSAMEKLLAQGENFSSVSVERLAEAAGIARATFYLHFRDKAELVTYLVEQVRKEIVSSAGAWFQDASLTTREDLEKTLRGIIGVYRKHHVILAAMAQTAPNNEQLAQLSRQMWDELCMQSRHAVAQLRKAGRAHEAASDQVADVLTLAIDHCATLHPEYLQGRRFEAFVKTWTHISWNALAAPER